MITAEYFNPERVSEHAAEVAELVEQEQAWLREARPTTFDNFQSPEVAAASIQRVIEARTINGLVLRRQDAAVGIGTIISSLTISHPEKKRHRLIGSQIDYWAADGVTTAEHDEITDLLLHEAGNEGVMAILSGHEVDHALGIPRTMQKVGLPGKIHVPFGRPDYGLRQVTAPLQVYVQRNEA